MKRLRSACGVLSAALVVFGGLSCSPAGGGGKGAGETVRLSGAGATFPSPLYMKWFKSYSKAHPNVQVDYQGIGSSGGQTAVIENKVDFGASDAAMPPENREKVAIGVQLLPMTAGSIVLGYNLAGIDNLKLSREAYAGIFLGKIRKWNAPEIAKTNPDAKLPDSEIHPVVRSEGSGTSFVFSQHLSAINEEFKKSVGAGMLPKWPVGSEARGNEGVATAIGKTAGAIGYLEYAFAKNIKKALLENKAGKFIEPTTASGQAALAGVKLSEDLTAWVPDPEGDPSYPIVTYTWIICYKKYDNAKKLAALKDLLTYALTDGQKEAEPLGYIPLLENVVQKDKAALGAIAAEAKE